ncbi:MAG: hypothetical protein ACKVP6_01200, partial [Mycobacterium sp.]
NTVTATFAADPAEFGNSVLVIDVATNAVVAAVPVGVGAAFWVALAPK